eukprot:2020917-Alexandrium_andersonii.AAC.1
MSASLVGSEMCIRDRKSELRFLQANAGGTELRAVPLAPESAVRGASTCACLLYTSDAADDM